MTKQEIANQLRQRTGMSQRQAMQAVELFLETVKEALKKGEKVSLVGFGTFQPKFKRARLGRNPKSKQQIEVPAKTVVVFKPGKLFREMVKSLPQPAE
ncbi:MAG: HU family DNA-binding protein [Candidatus Hydrogenedentota bacterium]|jgi:DNA-binding protein HU-beta|uniref:DNA-binding protein HBsu n=1 Tax=Sumerlaea chitinivorans TaxID=2250252 RepID=A0A2Z4Y290_SUMC1|nr:DNA-binding protein HBsu [Candidatus Sumerlaea chitinivorans]MCX7964874.1 HU family DNA-binding protein [Candidatus Sumerlaea chitinivorans]RMH30108.1 MAG: HU family DNA-binding protein [Candidatus Hydrogenedentota bacterium]GIX45144.1 MAG: transcriptional regulator [Candidatus Sumerlaea sp.]